LFYYWIDVVNFYAGAKKIKIKIDFYKNKKLAPFLELLKEDGLRLPAYEAFDTSIG
jgi:hypothetical protein